MSINDHIRMRKLIKIVWFCPHSPSFLSYYGSYRNSCHVQLPCWISDSLYNLFIRGIIVKWNEIWLWNSSLSTTVYAVDKEVYGVEKWGLVLEVVSHSTIWSPVPPSSFQIPVVYIDILTTTRMEQGWGRRRYRETESGVQSVTSDVFISNCKAIDIYFKALPLG